MVDFAGEILRDVLARDQKMTIEEMIKSVEARE